MRTGLLSRFVERAGQWAGELVAGARQADEVAHAAAPAADHALPATDAAAGQAALHTPLPEPVLAPEQLIHELDWAGRPSDRALDAMQELTTRRVLAQTTTQQQAIDRFMEISRPGIDDLGGEQLRELHALLDELPPELRVPQPEGIEYKRIADAAAATDKYSNPTSWYLGAGPRRVVATRAFHELPDVAAVRQRLHDLLAVREPTRDDIVQLRVILQGLPSERIPPEVTSFPQHAEAFRWLEHVTKRREGVAEGLATHQEAAKLLFQLRNHVLGADEQQLLAQLDELLEIPLERWTSTEVRELTNLMRHPEMPRPEVRMAWDLDEVLKQLNWHAKPEGIPLQPDYDSYLQLIYTDLRVARGERLGVMGNRTHELAGRVLEGTVTPAELQELRMITEREPALAAIVPEWLRAPDRDYRSVAHLVRIDRHHEELRQALLPMIDATQPTAELAELAAKSTLTDDEAIRMVRVAGRLDAFELPLPDVATAKLPRAIEQALLVSGGDPAVSRVSGNLARRHGWQLQAELQTIAEARRIVSVLNTPGSMAPVRSNVQQSVRDSLALVEQMLAPGSGIHEELRPLLERTREIFVRHQQRLGTTDGATITNLSGVRGYHRHPDYAEIGAAASNIELGAELLTAEARAKVAAREAAHAADTLSW